MRNKIVMSESDFIELVANLADETCCNKYGSKECVETNCDNCWAKLLNKFIEY